MSGKENYPCLFGLKDDCEARRFIAEFTVPMEPKVKVEPFEKTIPSDAETARKMGEAYASGALEALRPLLQKDPDRVKSMIHLCQMCPARRRKAKDREVVSPLV